MRLSEMRNLLMRLRPGMLVEPPADAAPTDASPAHASPTRALPAASPPVVAQPCSNAAAPSPAALAAISDRLWGDGLAVPGGAEEMLRLAAPLCLSDASTVLLLGEGAAGAAGAIAAQFHTWVEAYEPDRLRAEAAAARLAATHGRNAAKHVAMRAWSAPTTRLKPHFCHHALMVEPIRDAPAAGVLGAVTAAIKPGGQMALIQTVAGAAAERDDPAIAAWARSRGLSGGPPLLDEVSACLARLGFDVRVVEDQTRRHTHLAMHGWLHFVEELARQRPDRAEAAAIVVQAEQWMRRLRLLQDGKLRFVRWHALLTAASNSRAA